MIGKSNSGVDKDGHVHLAYKSTNDREAEGLYEELKKVLNHVGLAQHHVLDKNFYMTLNIPIANAIRVGEHLTERLG
jgi:hypothetical protein